MCRCDAFAVWGFGLTGVNVSLCLGYRGGVAGRGCALVVFRRPTVGVARCRRSGRRQLVGEMGLRGVSGMTPREQVRSYRVVLTWACSHTALSFIANKFAPTVWCLPGLAVIPRYRSSRASPAPTGFGGVAQALWEQSLLAIGDAAACSHTALSFFAGKPRSHRVWWWGTGIVGAELARDWGCRGVQSYRIIVLRGQASLQQGLVVWQACVGAELARDWGCCGLQSYRVIVLRGQARLPQGLVVWHRHCGSRACSRLGMPRLAVIPRHRSSRASPAPTGLGGLSRP